VMYPATKMPRVKTEKGCISQAASKMSPLFFPFVVGDCP
jgi:hypothetical protein